jgi:hypothetical protein
MSEVRRQKTDGKNRKMKHLSDICLLKSDPGDEFENKQVQHNYHFNCDAVWGVRIPVCRAGRISG